MIVDIIKDIVYGNSFLYSSFLVVMLAAFSGTLILWTTKIFQISKNNYYSNIFKDEVWERDSEKSINSASLIQDSSTIAKLFLTGLNTFKNNKDSEKNDVEKNESNIIDITNSTMKITLDRELNFLNQGFGLLSFNMVFIPYCALIMSLWDMISIFNTVDIGVLTLIMFVKPLFVIIYGLTMSLVLALICVFSENKIKEIENISKMFINEFTNKLQRKYYK